MRALGDILHVDLAAPSVARRPVDPAVLRRVLLGRGLNSLTLLENIGAEVEPLDAANPLLFTCGLLTGTQAPSAARLQVSARSPLTGLLGSSSVGGTVGPALRANGVQSLQVTGRADAPVYLHISAGNVEVRDASHLWGLDVKESVRALGDELGEPGLVMFVIGPAGEHLLPLACIVTQRGHAAGRTGMGAVMGSKNLKAVVVRSAKDATRADEDARAAVKRYLAKVKAAPNYADKAAHGTSSAVNPVNEMGMLGSYNYQSPRFAQADAIDGTSMDKFVERLRACSRCPVHCKAELELTSGPYAGLKAERPDFEPIVSWGSKSGLADPEAIIYLHSLCDLFGIDSVSAGNAVAFAMHLWQEGILTAEDTGGLELAWGDVAVMETLVRQMAAGEGFGALLGLGIREAARVIGRGAEKYAYHVKGLEITAFDPRGASASGLGYAVSSRGGDFTSVYARHEFSLTPAQAKDLYGEELAADRTSPVGKAAMVKRSIIICAVLDSIGLCKIPALTLVNEFDLVSEAELVSAIAGMPMTPEELFEIGERIMDIERLFNMRFGADAADDVLPALFLDEPMPAGPTAGSTVDLETMLAEFYLVMGWTEEGVPTEARLRRLGLGEFVPHRPEV
ncbi:MAG: aldehyde ferredoxin oxidoreductase family protein [Thermoleophilia bacterium]